MRKTWIAGAIAVVAVFAGVVWFAGRTGTDEVSGGKAETARQPGEPVEYAKPAGPAPLTTRASASARPKVDDPRLAALMVSPDNGLIEYLADPEGRVIREVDNDPNSIGYRKPLREYSYAGDKVIRLVKYLYTGNEVQTVTADVIYKADGSIDQYRESTGYTYGKAN